MCLARGMNGGFLPMDEGGCVPDGFDSRVNRLADCHGACSWARHGVSARETETGGVTFSCGFPFESAGSSRQVVVNASFIR